MQKLIEFLRKQNLYAIFLHIAVIVLVIQVLILAKQNRELKSGGQRVEILKAGDYFSFANLEPLSPQEGIDSTARQLLFIFTTTCPFCKENLPKWMKIVEQLKQKYAIVQAISLDSIEKTSSYVKQNQINIPIYIVRDTKHFQEVNKVSVVPMTIISGGTGRVEAVWDGLLSDHQTQEIVNSILK